MLFARRKRLKDLVDREAAGESFWTDELPEPARVRMVYAIKDLTEGTVDYGYGGFDLIDFSRNQVLRDVGQPSLAGQQDAERDVIACLGNGSEELVFSLLEAIGSVAEVAASKPYSDISAEVRAKFERRLPHFVDTVRTVLREHRVAFDFVDGRIVPLQSLELHEAVVVPVITLLGGDPSYAPVEKAYMAALEEIHNGKPEDAITDAGTALQGSLQLLGCDGNALGPLIRSAHKKGLLGPHDSPLVQSILSAMDWVSADRSTKGDAHNADEASREDAWLTVHVAGALILRLLRGPARTDS